MYGFCCIHMNPPWFCQHPEGGLSSATLAEWLGRTFHVRGPLGDLSEAMFKKKTYVSVVHTVRVAYVAS